jgi:hypothetical protein
LAVNINGVEVPRERFIIFICTGNSQMYGFGSTDGTVHPRVWALFEGGENDGKWVPAKDPLEEFPSVKYGSLATRLGKAFAEKYPDYYFGIIQEAGWNAMLRETLLEGPWYESIMARYGKVKNDGILGGVACAFHITECKNGSSEVRSAYTSDALELMSRMRADFNSPDLPFIWDSGPINGTTKHGNCLENKIAAIPGADPRKKSFVSPAVPADMFMDPEHYNGDGRWWWAREVAKIYVEKGWDFWRITTPDTQKPTVPQNFRVRTLADIAVVLDWDFSADNALVKQYEVFKGNALAVAVDGWLNRARIDGLGAQTPYSFKVRAVDYAGNAGDFSPVLNLTTAPGGPDYFPPTAPTNATLKLRSYNSVTLCWGAAKDDHGVAGYYLYNGATKIGEAAATAREGSGTIPQNTVNLRIAVKAVDKAGNISDPSDEIIIPPLKASVMLVAEKESYDAVCSTDQFMYDKMIQAGYGAFIRANENAALPSGHTPDAVVVCHHAQWSDGFGYLKGLQCPIVSSSASFNTALGMSGSCSGTGNNAFAIMEPSHPLANGLTGTFYYIGESTSLKPVTCATPASAATIIGKYLNGGTAAVFCYDKGDQMVGLAAPETRIGLFFNSAFDFMLENRRKEQTAMWDFFMNALNYACSGENYIMPIQLLYPNGGETFRPGDTVMIQWKVDKSLVTAVDIELSVDGGLSWNGVASSSIPSESGYYKWVVPSSIEGTSLQNATCMMRAISYDDKYPDNSDKPFTISTTAMASATNIAALPTVPRIIQHNGNTVIRNNGRTPLRIDIFSLNGRRIGRLIVPQNAAAIYSRKEAGAGAAVFSVNAGSHSLARAIVRF